MGSVAQTFYFILFSFTNVYTTTNPGQRSCQGRELKQNWHAAGLTEVAEPFQSHIMMFRSPEWPIGTFQAWYVCLLLRWVGSGFVAHPPQSHTFHVKEP